MARPYAFFVKYLPGIPQEISDPSVSPSRSPQPNDRAERVSERGSGIYPASHILLTRRRRLFLLLHEAFLCSRHPCQPIKPVYTPLALRDWFGAAPETRNITTALIWTGCAFVIPRTRGMVNAPVRARRPDTRQALHGHAINCATVHHCLFLSVILRMRKITCRKCMPAGPESVNKKGYGGYPEPKSEPFTWLHRHSLCQNSSPVFLAVFRVVCCLFYRSAVRNALRPSERCA